MKNLLYSLTAMLLLGACQQTANPGGSDSTPKPSTPIPAPAFATGADVSWLSEMEHDGKTFKKKDGTKADCFAVLKDCGVNAIRLRVWVDPTGGWSGKDDMVNLARRAYEAGLPVMVDFHYSDFFADPSRQDIPAKWVADKGDVDKMAAHVTDHTTEVLKALEAAGVTPAWIQIGNETTVGMLWPLGKIWAVGSETVGGWDAYAKLYKAGYGAAKAVFPKALVGAHLNNAYQDRSWWVTELKNRGGKLDYIGLSHYPQDPSAPENCNALAIAGMKKMYATHTIPVMISEIGVKTQNNETAAAQCVKEFMTEVKKLSFCSGVFYWEPEVYDWWKPAIYKSLGWGAYDSGAFRSDGKPSTVMDALCK